MKNRERSCELVILQTSDIHGNLMPISYGNNQEVEYGLAKLALPLKEEMKQADNSFLIDNGDLIQGTPLTYHHARHQPNEQNPMVKILNYLKYDAAVIGNHEFNYGQDLLEKAVSESNFPWLSANILESGTNQPAFGRPFMIKEFDNGLRVALLGLTTHYIPNWENPNHIKGLEFADAYSTAKEWVKYLQQNEQFDLLIVSYHGGIECEPETGEPAETLTGENQGYRICTEIEGIDVLLTGHQHRKLVCELNGVTVVQPGFNAQSFGKIQVSFEFSYGKWQVKDKSAAIIEVNEAKAEQAILELAKSYEIQSQKWLDQPIGTIVGDMSVRSAFDIRMEDNPLIEFINKVQMDAAGADISATALFHNESPGFPAEVTMRDIVSNYIYPNTLKVIRITGADLKAALEKSALYFDVKDGELIVNPSFEKPKPQHYNYDMWEGIQYTLDISRPAGERVTELNYKDEPVKSDASYDVVMNNYRAGGGGNYPMFKGKPVLREIQRDMTEILADYFQKHGIIHATCNHNWRVIH